MNADQILDRIKDCNIYEIRRIMGVQCIKVLGYFYPMDGIWKHIEFLWYERHVKDFLANEDKWEEWECESKQTIEDLSAKWALKVYRGYAPIPLAYSEITEDTPEGVYIAM